MAYETDAADDAPAPPPEGTIDQDWLDEVTRLDSTRDSNYRLFHAYYTGHLDDTGNRPPMSDRVKAYLESSGIPFVENFCEPVIDVYAERLRVQGFTVEGANQGQKQGLEEWVRDLMFRNRLDSKQDVIHTTALMKGDAVVVVDYNETAGLPRLHFNRPELWPTIEYDDDEPDCVAWAVKCWRSRSAGPLNPGRRLIERANVYFPDRVERYYRLAVDGPAKRGWQPWLDEGQTEWLMWLTENGAQDGVPLGCPVFHFRHKPLGGTYGRSDLASVVPFQDELTKQLIDLAEILDYQGWPQRWGTGIDNENADLHAQPGVIVTSPAAEARFGQFDAADPSGALAAIEGTLSRLARRSRTPMHLLVGGTPPSGEALKTSESGIVSKALMTQTPFGDVWEQAATMCLKLGRLHGDAPDFDPDKIVLRTEWVDPETRNDKELAERAQILDGLGVSKHTTFSMLGLDYEEEQDWKQEEKDTLDEQAARLLAAGGGAPDPMMPVAPGVPDPMSADPNQPDQAPTPGQ